MVVLLIQEVHSLLLEVEELVLLELWPLQMVLVVRVVPEQQTLLQVVQ
jgi:hypothetical protein